MKKETTAQRLKLFMEQHALKQVDILDLSRPYCEKYGVKMNKSDISQYVSGKAEPSKEKLVILSKALGVTTDWLIGLDEDMFLIETINPAKTKTDSLSRLLSYSKYLSLSKENQHTIDDMINFLSEQEKKEKS